MTSAPRSTTAVRRTDAPVRDDTSSRNWLELVETHVQNLRYGVVQITIHDGKVVQIDRTERMRLDPAGEGARRQPYTVLR